ncbi:hypothetical protein CYY_009441 [Polysphondylium violaceum]|uniref:Ribonuclease n=1 Tax=Polysphondylium violaceum TaxID=133409 RepID=A0A8J4UPH1_9MYCE|nr:hypothetical protein CYY_009441 [Polysphondylium violaceum]
MFRFISKYKCTLNLHIRYFTTTTTNSNDTSSNVIEKKKFTIKNSTGVKLKVSAAENKLYNQEIKKKSGLKEFQFINTVYCNDINIPAVKKQQLSVLPETLVGQTVSISIDEAGKGSALGPLVVSVVVLDAATEQYLKRMGVKDSKMLSKAKRETLYDVILEQAIYCQSIHLSAEEIDKRRHSYTLNQIEANLFYQLIQDCIKALPQDQPCNIFIDSIENNATAFSLPFVHSFPQPIYNITCETKADSNYTSVGAASIIAKVERDRYIENLEVLMNEKIGSGYPSDSTTIKFIKKFYHNTVELRKSWNLSFLDGILFPPPGIDETKEKDLNLLSSPSTIEIETTTTTTTVDITSPSPSPLSPLPSTLSSQLIETINKINELNALIKIEMDEIKKKQQRKDLRKLKAIKKEIEKENPSLLGTSKDKAKLAKKTKAVLIEEIGKLEHKLLLVESQLEDMKAQISILQQSKTISTPVSHLEPTRK